MWLQPRLSSQKGWSLNASPDPRKRPLRETSAWKLYLCSTPEAVSRMSEPQHFLSLIVGEGGKNLPHREPGGRCELTQGGVEVT